MSKVEETDLEHELACSEEEVQAVHRYNSLLAKELRACSLAAGVKMEEQERDYTGVAKLVKDRLGKVEIRIAWLETRVKMHAQTMLIDHQVIGDKHAEIQSLKLLTEVRPMNKAPRDGTKILGRTLSEDGKRCIWFEVWWSDKACGWWSHHGDYWTPDGWIPCPPSTKS